MKHGKNNLGAAMLALTFLTILLPSARAEKMAAEAVNDFGNPSANLPAAAAQKLLTKIHLANVREIRAGTLAMDKGDSVLVQALGDRIARDHRMAETMVLQTADKLGVTLGAAGIGEADRMASLEDSYGRSFDKNYVAMMIDAHLSDTAALSAAFDQAPKGSEMRAFLGKLLPILKQHLQVAENVRPWI